MSRILLFAFCCSWILLHSLSLQAADLKLLFLGDQGGHQPIKRFDQVATLLDDQGIHLTYTEDLEQLNSQTLSQFAGLIVYANIDQIQPEKAKVILDFVEQGGGYVPLHSASFCFRNSPELIALTGAQFEKHGAGLFTTIIENADHPVMHGFGGFTSWDETYIHTRHNEQDRVVLEYRIGGDQANGTVREPWTWGRTHGKGRVFYTAWGHDERTWGNPGFQNLLQRGIRWACGDDPQLAGPFHENDRFVVPEMTTLAEDLPPFEYLDVGAKIPNYVPSEGWGKQAAPKNMMQAPLSAEESQKHLVTPVGFEAKLFVSDPLLQGKPIAMSWDERGRLWICETVDYPNDLQPPSHGNDRIVICEDTNGDGVADKRIVFAEGLSIPTSIVFARGGVIVQNGTETLFLKDTDDDDRADFSKVLIHNWTLGDTHGGVSNLRYGLDNWIWGMQGYNQSAPILGEKTDASVQGAEKSAQHPAQEFRQGFFRFRLTQTDPPEVAELEFVRSTDNNTWGLGISEEGLIFGSTANHNPSVYMPIANRYYERVRNWSPQQLRTIADTYKFRPITDKVRQVDHHGGYTAGAGHALYTGRAYPQTWWNRTAFVCGPTGHLVGTFVLFPTGADFESTSPLNLLASDDEWTAPIMAEVGPDGQVWVIDWYNYIVQHNPTPEGFENGKGNAYVSDLRDKKHGRVYRVVNKEADKQSSQPLSLTLKNVDLLIQGLQNPTMQVRLEAQRLLIERGQLDVVPALVGLIQNQSVDQIGLNTSAIHSLWVLQGLGALNQDQGPAWEAAVSALSHPSAGVRRNAIQVLPHLPASVAHILQRDLLNDADAQVQLAAFLALSDASPDQAVGEALAKRVWNLKTLDDRWRSEAAISAAATHGEYWLIETAQHQFHQSQTPDNVSDHILTTTRIVAEHMARSELSGEQLGRILKSLEGVDPQVQIAMLDGFAAGWPRNHVVTLDANVDETLGVLFEKSPVISRVQLIKLAKLWGTHSLDSRRQAAIEALLTEVQNPAAALNLRVQSAAQLIQIDPESSESVESLLDLITLQTPFDLSSGLLSSLLLSTSPDLGELLIEKSQNATPAVRSEVIRILLSRPVTTEVLLNAIENTKMETQDLNLDQRQALSSHPDRRLRERAKKILSSGGELPNPDRQKVVEEKTHLTQMTGDPVRGKAIFKEHCMKCHTHSGEGERIGPDLTGMAVHPKLELLVHTLDPSRSVEGNFRSYTVVLDDGRVLTGMLAGESRTSIELIDTTAKRTSIPRDEIEELISTRNSLMPEGFEKLLTDQDLVNLLEFLTHKGQFVPIPLDQYATIVTTKGMFYDERAPAERLIFEDWSPKVFEKVPFILTDPQGEKVPNAIMLYGPLGKFPPQMPRSVTLPCRTPAKAIHLLSGVSGWGATQPAENGISMIVRLHYADGQVEDHPLQDGQHFADYISNIDVPQSQLAFRLRSQQIRYLSIQPKRSVSIDTIELVKGPDRTAPVVMAVTVETGTPDSADSEAGTSQTSTGKSSTSQPSTGKTSLSKNE